jgi:hypothetical protein
LYKPNRSATDLGCQAGLSYEIAFEKLPIDPVKIAVLTSMESVKVRFVQRFIRLMFTDKSTPSIADSRL